MPCFSSSAVIFLKESISVSNAESQVALPFRITAVFGVSVISSPNGSAVCTVGGAAAAGGVGAGVAGAGGGGGRGGGGSGRGRRGGLRLARRWCRGRRLRQGDRNPGRDDQAGKNGAK